MPESVSVSAIASEARATHTSVLQEEMPHQVTGCPEIIKYFNPPQATVSQMKEYVECAEQLYPGQRSLGENFSMMFSGVALVLLILAIWRMANPKTSFRVEELSESDDAGSNDVLRGDQSYKRGQ